MPASSFSRSTESHNQDKVSMGTIASRDCLRVLELSEQTAVAAALAAVQALDLRERIDGVLGADPQVAEFRSAVRGISAFVDEDRALEPDLRLFLERLRSGALDKVLP